MSDGLKKIPFLARIKETNEKIELVSYGFGAQDNAGNFYHKTKYKVIKPLPHKTFYSGNPNARS